MDEDSAWKKVISLKYGIEEGEWITRKARGNLGGSLWIAISKEADLLRQNCTFVLGDGSRIRFWEDAWCGDQPLCVVFPGFYSMAGSKGEKVADLWEFSGDMGAWNPRFLRPFNDWEMDSVQHFISLMVNKSLSPQKRDVLFWKGDIEGKFTVKAYF